MPALDVPDEFMLQASDVAEEITKEGNETAGHLVKRDVSQTCFPVPEKHRNSTYEIYATIKTAGYYGNANLTDDTGKSISLFLPPILDRFLEILHFDPEKEPHIHITVSLYCQSWHCRLSSTYNMLNAVLEP